MKKLFTLLFLSLCFTFTKAQNLVPNWSFEDTTSCPTSGGSVGNAVGWYVAEKTPDYFNGCAPGGLTSISVPNNFLGYRNAATGYAYCGLICYGSTQFYHEKIGVKLIDTLKKGKRYNVSFKVSSVCSYFNPMNGACNKLGMLFSTFKYDLSHLSPTKNYCQFHSDSIVQDTIGWVKLSGSFIADSNYSHLTLGNFYNDSLVDTVIYWNQSFNVARLYYFIDDIFVGYDSLQDVGITTAQNSDIKEYPNPANDVINITASNSFIQQIEIYNDYGIDYFNEKNTIPKNFFSINVRHFTSGIYFLKIKTNETIFTKKITIIH